MSTENNSELLYDNSVQILTDLIAFKTISGEDNSSLIDSVSYTHLTLPTTPYV